MYLKRDYDFKDLTEAINWDWIKNGVKVSIPFFIGTLAYKVIEFSDRYMIDYYMTKADVGVYVFFGGIANTVNIVVFTLVIMIPLNPECRTPPKLVVNTHSSLQQISHVWVRQQRG